MKRVYISSKLDYSCSNVIIFLACGKHVLSQLLAGKIVIVFVSPYNIYPYLHHLLSLGGY